MTPKIKTIPAKKLIGMRLTMSLAENKTYKLWSTFMPRRFDIKNTVSKELYEIQNYDEQISFKQFTPQTVFEKWASIEVSDLSVIPEGMEQHTIKGGKYAVFIHKGTTEMFFKTSQYIFGSWLPSSGYELDNRAHFQVLYENHNPNDPNNEEEVWIPIK